MPIAEMSRRCGVGRLQARGLGRSLDMVSRLGGDDEIERAEAVI
jgi:hypothetical protein